jgi:tetratricopeptide (TPR) repeat protein/mono/diheme cytochrome c family protein
MRHTRACLVVVATLTLALLVVVGCSPSNTSTVAAIEIPPLDIPQVALDPEGAEPPPDVPPPAEAAFELPPPGTLTFTEHVAPIVIRHCADCHHDGGAAPFTLTSYDDVRKRSGQIVGVTRSGYMPPWQPAHGYNEFVGERRMTNEEIELLARWVEEGAVEGDPSRMPPLPEFPEGWQLGTPDLVVDFSESYTLRAGGPDVFRNFVVPDVLDEARWIKGMEFHPDNPRVVHHAEFRIDDTEGALERDREDAEPGFEGMDVDSAKYPEGFFLNWVPGKTPAHEPGGLAWMLGRGTDLVVQLHMLPSGKEETIRPQMGLHFADGAPRGVTPVNLRLGSTWIDIPAGESEYVLQDTYTLPVDVEVLSVLPHAHYIGKRIRGFATLPDGTKRWLVRIDDWDFNWQDNYVYEEPIELPKGTVLGMKYIYDNSADNERNPHNPPIRVAYGPRSSDEMGDLWVRVRPKGAMDRRLLKQHHGAFRRVRDAMRKEEIVREHPDPEAHKELGVIFERLEMFDRAALHHQAAVALAPDDPQAHELLALTLQRTGDVDGALRHLTRCAELQPDNATVRFNMGAIAGAAGRRDEAMTHLAEAVRLDPDYQRARLLYGQSLLEDGHAARALEHLEAALHLDPDSTAAQAGVALLLATHPDESARDPRRALELATRAAETTGRRDPGALRALAAAHASNGAHAEAIAAAERGLTIARRSPSAGSLAPDLQADLRRYREEAATP